MATVGGASVGTLGSLTSGHISFEPQPLDADDLEFVIDFVRRHAAIVVPPEKAYLVESRLAMVVRRTGSSSFARLVARLRDEPDGELGERIIEAMVTAETRFFRDRHPFDAIRRSVLPELIVRSRDTRQLGIWSAACSSGQEPYSLLMMLAEQFHEVLASWDIRFLASDISQSLLDRTRAGRYSPLEINRGLSSERATTHFDRTGNCWQIKEALRDRFELSRFSLAGDWPCIPKFDLILMRNVLIYFDTETRERILERICCRLQPHGCLLLGGAETALNLGNRLQPQRYDDVTFYRLAS